MARLVALLALVASTAFGSDIGRQSPCYMSGAFVDCYQPVEHTSMEGPASPTVSGYLSSGDWRAFNAAVSSVTSVTGTAPIVSSGGATPAISITQSSLTGNGYLSSGDWQSFNGRQPAGSYVPTTTAVNTTSPLAGGGDLSTTRTLSIPAATAAVNGYLASGDWLTFNGRGGAYTQGNLTETTSAVLTIGSGTSAVFGSGTTIQVTKSDASHPGYLASADWATFNGRQAAGSYALQSTAINTTSPLAGGGDLSTTRTLSIPVATAAANGYLASSDWATFNGKGTGTVTTVTGTAPVVSSGGTAPAISIPAATLTANGYLASSDWALFNGKDQARTVGNLTEATSAVLTIGSGTGAVIGSGTTIQVVQSSLTASGYLSSGDWNAFNAVARIPGSLTQNGYLASSDWATFNNKRVALAGSTLTGVIDGSAAAAGFKVNAGKSSPSTADADNVYTSTYTPTFTRTSSVFTCQTWFITRVGGIVYEHGYCSLDSGTGTGDITITLGVTPNAFSGTAAIARSQADGACYADTFSSSGYIGGTASASTVSLSAVGATATGLRCFFAYRL